MKRRKFVVNGSVFGAGLLGAARFAPGALRTDTLEKPKSSNFSNSLNSLNSNSEEKPVAFTVPPLPYSNDALEPYIDARTMEIHHDKHHGAYVTNLNKALEGHADLQAKSLDDLLKVLKPIREKFAKEGGNNGGGNGNPPFSWLPMKKGEGVEPRGTWEQQ